MSEKPTKDGNYGKEVEYTVTRSQTKFSYSTLKNSYILVWLVVTAIIFIMLVFQASKIRYLETKFTELETKVVDLETKVVDLETKSKNAYLNAQLRNWNDNKSLGVVFGSDSKFNLAQNHILSPNVAWIKLDRWNTLNKQQQQIIPIAPDFVIELLSTSDSLQIKQEKMREYIDSGVRLGLLINRKSRQVEIYRSGKDVEILNSPPRISGEDVLNGFVLNLEMVW
jgi:Uma2 family endonuclease